MEMPQLSLTKSFVNDPARVWSALSNEYAGKSSQNTATLLIDLFGLRMGPNPTVQEAKEHFEKMIDLNIRLKEVDEGRAMSDVVMAVLMAMSLPNDSEGPVQALVRAGL